MQKQRGPTLSLRAKGPLAIFTRPELKTERVSYEVPAPSAVRGIYEAIYWKPAIKWHIERIYLLNEITFTSIKRNELTTKSNQPTKAQMEGEGLQNELSIEVDLVTKRFEQGKWCLILQQIPAQYYCTERRRLSVRGIFYAHG